MGVIKSSLSTLYTLSLEPKTQPFISEMGKISMIYLFTSGGAIFSSRDRVTSQEINVVGR